MMESEQEIVLVENIKDETIWGNTHTQLKKRAVLVGFHYGKLSPLPSLWCYPKVMNMIQLITLYQLGNPMDGIPPLRLVRPQFEQCGSCFLRMGKVMKLVEHYTRKRGMWTTKN